MSMSLVLGLWAAVLAALLVVSMMRYTLGRREDDHIHVSDSEQQAVVAQSQLAHKLDVLDRWKTGLIVLAVVSGLVIGAVYLYRGWTQGAVGGLE